MNIKTPVNLFTTFSKGGYKQYGKRWLDSVAQYWPDANVKIYTDFDLQVDPSIKVINFDEVFPDHSAFKTKVTNYYGHNLPKGPVIGNKTIKFSYKGFCIANELLTNNSGITVWTDADTQVLKNVDIDYTKLLNKQFLACQVEKARHANPHVESGILFFDSANSDSKRFGELLKDFYNTEKLFSIKKPYDGYIIGKILKSKNMNYVDLNENFNVTNKRSTAESTFLHPVLKEHFVHWIGNIKT